MSKLRNTLVISAVLPALLLSQSSFGQGLRAGDVVAQAAPSPAESEDLKKKRLQQQAPAPRAEPPAAPRPAAPAPSHPAPPPEPSKPATPPPQPKLESVPPRAPAPAKPAPAIPAPPKPAAVEQPAPAVKPATPPAAPKPERLPPAAAPKPAVPVAPVKPLATPATPEPKAAVPPAAPPAAPAAPLVPAKPPAATVAPPPPAPATAAPANGLKPTVAPSATTPAVVPGVSKPIVPATPAAGAPDTKPAPGTPPAPPPGQTGAPVLPKPGQPSTAPAIPGAKPVPTPLPAQPAQPVKPGQPAQPGAAVQPVPAQPGQPAATGEKKSRITPLEAAGAGLALGLVGGFIAGNATQRYEDVQRNRQESEVNGARLFREPGRTIIQEDDRSFIVHDENERFRDLGGPLRSERRDGVITTIYDRGDGTQIVTVTDDNGRLLRRSRRLRDGRDFILIDNTYAGPPRSYDEEVVYLPPPPLRIARERYIVDADQADENVVYEALTAPPVAPLPRRYTLDEVRNSPDLRAHMRSIDINTINFDSGSFAVSPDQAQRLSLVARQLLRAIQTKPNEVYLIEGHTDAVGSDVDNLSLSDRRAQSVATILTTSYNVPPENLTTQGYGSQYLKVQTQDASRDNRRVTLRRITPLITGQGAPQGAAPPPDAPAQ